MMNMVRCYKDYSSGLPLGPGRRGEAPLSHADRAETFLLIKEELDRLRGGGTSYRSPTWEGRLSAEMAWL